jgi:hypothetical protein
MNTDWYCSSNELPREGQQIEFVLDHRNVAMQGTYHHYVFQSHWAEYAIERVRSWRNRSEQSDQATPAPNRAVRALSSAHRPDMSHDPLPERGIAHAA